MNIENPHASSLEVREKHFLVAATRRLPSACEERLIAKYFLRKGDDNATYSSSIFKAHAEGASALIVTPAERLDANTINSLPQTVKIIATFSVGHEHIDLAAASASGLIITNTPGVLTAATADLTLLLFLAAARRAREGQKLIHSGNWSGIRPTQLLGTQVKGKRLGIIGMGRIGRAVANRSRSFGMKVYYHNRQPINSNDNAEAIYVPSLNDLISQSEILSLHCPLTPETKNILNAQRIANLPEGAIVVNTARGPLIDDNALIEALLSRKIASAGLDVYASEPNIDKRYLTMENVFLLPHLGSATKDTRAAMGMLAIDSIEAVLNGHEPPHQIL